MRWFRRLWELPGLVLLNWLNHFWNLWLWLAEIRAFYGNPALRRADWLWMRSYGLQSPFDLSRRALQAGQLPEDLSIYGETPWTTLRRIARAAGLQPGSQVIDLGCGTGRTLLFFYYALGCPARGYELVPAFVSRFEALQARLGLGEAVQIFAQNWFEADLRDGDFLLLVGTCYSDEHLQQASRCLSQLRRGAVVASVSYALDSPDFELWQHFEAAFSWGRATVFLQRRI